MARTREGALLTERHRLLQGSLRALAIRDLLHLWGTVDPENLAATIGPFTKAGAIVVRAGRRASAAAASRYYVQFRQVEGVRGTVVVTLAEPTADGVIESAIRGAGLAGIVRARSRGETPDKAARNGFVKMSGSASSLVIGGARETLLGAVRADSHALGYQRVTDGDPCSFCAMVASRGIVAFDEDSAGFEAHNHCGCTAEPAFEGSKILPANEQFRAEWDDVTQGLPRDEAIKTFRQFREGRTE